MHIRDKRTEKVPVLLNDKEELFSILQQMIQERPSTVLAIDGPCASGKTTLADEIRDRLGARVIPMDDFFLPAELRTEQRYAAPGGNVHYERILADIAPFLQSKAHSEEIVYRPFDCTAMAYGPERRVPRAPLTVIEGSYSLHEVLRHLYDLRLLLRIEPEEQERRLLARVGAGRIDDFVTRWIPLENLYFENMQPHLHCDYIL